MSLQTFWIVAAGKNYWFYMLSIVNEYITAWPQFGNDMKIAVAREFDGSCLIFN